MAHVFKSQSEVNGFKTINTQDNFRDFLLVTQLCLTLCYPMDCSTPGSSVHEISQARILEWVAIAFSGGNLPDPRIELASPEFPALQMDSLPCEPPGKPILETNKQTKRIMR